MAEGVKGGKRPYRAPRRDAQAATTRSAVLAAARTLFLERGYTRTTVADIASTAGVAVDTVYATVGRKPVLLRQLIETALSGTDDVVPAAQRDYVLAIRAAVTAEEKIQAYSDALPALQQRLAPIFVSLQEAAHTDADCSSLWAEISDRRARNMREFAADLRGTGQLREDLTDEDVADIVWSMNAIEYWNLLVVGRGWTPERFGRWLADAWIRLLVAPHRRIGSGAPSADGSGTSGQPETTTSTRWNSLRSE